MKHKLYRLLTAALLPAIVQAASAAVLLTDNFTVLPGGVNNQDVNQLLGSGRQTGPLASVSSGFFSTYTFGGDHHQIGNTTTDVGQPGGAANSAYVLLAFGGGTFQSDLDIAKVSTGPLTIEVDMYNNGSNPGGGADTQWVALTLGVPGNTGPNSGGAGEFGFLKRANGGVQVFQSGSDITSGALDVVGTATDDHWTVTFTDTAGTGSAFTGNGSKVTLQNGATVLGTYALNQLKSSGLRLGFKCDNNRFAGIANLKISGTLPAAPALAVLFHDNFNAYYGLNSDNNLNLNVDLADRQSGLLTPVNYTAGGNHHQVGNSGTGVNQPFGSANSGYVLTAFGGNFYSDLDIPVVSTGVLKIEVDMYVNNNDWLALGLRHVPTDFFPIVPAGSGEFGFLRQSDGGVQLFQNGGGITPSGWNNANTAPDNHMTFIFTDTAGTGSAFNGNGSKVTVMSGATTLGTVTLAQLSSSGLKLGFKADNNQLGGLDNLTISGTAPAVIAPALVKDINPLRSEVATGAPWTLSVTANGTPLNYQWYNESGPISGATTNSYTFNAVAGLHSYYCTVTNAAGTVYSSSAVVLSATNLVTVNNFSFENGYTPAFGNGGIPLQWTDYNPSWSGVAGGKAQFSPSIIPDGTLYYARNTGPSDITGGVYQDVGALQPNTTYNLTVAIGRGNNKGVDPNGLGDWSPGIISLLNGTDNTGAVLASTTGYPDVAGTWQDYTATFTTGPTVSGDLTISLAVAPASTYQSLFDNVRLTTGGFLPENPALVQDILPASVTTVVGDQVVFTASFSNAPAANLQWQFISTNGVVSDLSGQTTETLTFSNVQLTNTGSYRLKAVNQTNGLAVYFSSAASLVVSPVPAPVNNVVITAASQTGWGPGAVGISTNFIPTWTVNTDGDLILGSLNGSVGTPNTVYSGLGNFGLAGAYGDPQILSDGITGNLVYNPGNGGNFTLDTCGPYSTDPLANYAGISLTYTLNTVSAVNGFDLTNIVVYGGWGDNTHDEQRYQVLYSTVAAPTTFIPMTGWVDYLPTNPSGYQSATRTTLTPAAGVMAANVYAVQINFNSQNPVPKNSYSGYAEIIVGGKVAPARPLLTQDISPAAAEDVVGSKLTFAPAFINATSYQWLKNGTNLPGATLPVLTLNNLQLTDAATNGGYSLKVWNANGTNVSSACTVYVDPAPTATNNVVAAFAYQSSLAAGFGPTWDTSLLSASLIAGQNPPAGGSDTDSRFVGGGDHAAGLSVLTDGNYGTFASDGTHPAFAAAGHGAGNYVIYTLGSDVKGYDVTNILIAGGWNDAGRDSQYYTIQYSTVANPDMFIPLVSVANNLSGGNGKAAPASGVPTVVRSTFTPASGVLASHVYAIQVNFEFPHDVANGYSGYSEISVFGAPSATAPAAGPVITGTHDTSNPTVLTLATPNLIPYQLPSSFGAGSFANEGCNVTNLTDGILGSGSGFAASCGGDGSAVPWIVFTPTNGSWNLSNIVVYTMWNDYGRCGQFYNVSYATTSNPTLFLPLASVGYNPFVPEDGTHSANQVQIAPPVGQELLASNVVAVKFDFTSQGVLNYGWSGYTEIVLQGTNVQSLVVPPTLPTKFDAPRVSGGNLILTGSGGAPAGHAYVWLSTTNLSAPITWTTSYTGNLDGAGAFSNAIPVSLTNRSVFFRFMMP